VEHSTHRNRELIHCRAERAMKQPFLGTDDLITKFRAKFERLRKNFESGVCISTALLLSRTATTVDVIRACTLLEASLHFSHNLHTGRDQLLLKLKPADMDEYNHSVCLPNTRLDVIKSITEWMADESSDQRRVLWLFGLAGAGKSTLMTTIVKILRDVKRLGGYFFFNRDNRDRNVTTIIRTLAYQLAIFDASIGAEISQIVESNPNLAGQVPGVQFPLLLSANALSSVTWSGGPIVLVIDALDECGSERDLTSLMQALSKGFEVLPPFIRVIMTSRQERVIKNTLASHPAVCSYDLDTNSMATKKDILTFLRHHLSEIPHDRQEVHFESNWPDERMLTALSERAADLFVWASTAYLYIKEGYDPPSRLDELIKQQSVRTFPEPFAHLDRLYETGLQAAGPWADPAFCSDCCNIFGVILCARLPLSCDAIDSLLVSPRRSFQAVSRLGCFLRGGDKTDAIRILHPSFHDYLSVRCRAEVWFIDLEHHNENLAVHCIELLKKRLRRNICGLTLPHPALTETLPEAVSYACRFWVEHVCMISRIAGNTEGREIPSVMKCLDTMLNQHLLHWFEAMSILRKSRDTIRLLDNLAVWLMVSFSSGHLRIAW
jgi:NACHT domain